MRLANRLKNQITKSVQASFGDVDIYLFGSRTDDAKKDPVAPISDSVIGGMLTINLIYFKMTKTCPIIDVYSYQEERIFLR